MISALRAAAETFAVEAGGLTLRSFGGIIDHDVKPDGTPVTPVDREVETLLRERIGARFPEHGILGEELGESQPGARVRWIIDPIDGTQSFLRGVPLFAVLLGVEVDGEAAVGVAHFPALQETVSAGVGLGCTWNGRPCEVSRVDRLDRSLVLTTDPVCLPASSIADGWRTLSREAAVTRGWGDAWGHILVATGRAELMVDPILATWDAAPLLPILVEAGGRFTSIGGVTTIQGGSGVSSNGLVHDTALEMLRGE